MIKCCNGASQILFGMIKLFYISSYFFHLIKKNEMVSFIISIVSLTPAPFVDYLMERKTTHNDVKISKPKRQ